MNLLSAIKQKEMPGEPWTDLERAVIFTTLVPYVFKIDPRKNKVWFYLPPDSWIEPKEMNRLFESWSTTYELLESLACDDIGRPMVQKKAGIIFEAVFSPHSGFRLIYDEVVRRRKEEGLGFLKHNRGLEILIYDNFAE